jgi:hypothetical protein
VAAMEQRAVGDADRQIRQPRSAHEFGQRDKAGPEAGLWLEISSALTRFDKKRMNAIAEPCRASGACASAIVGSQPVASFTSTLMRPRSGN